MMFNSQNPADAVTYSLSKMGGAFQLSRNIRLYECVSDTDEVLIHHATVLGVQAIRDHFNKPISINSFYRSEAHNKRVGGRPASRHLSGMAADIAIFGAPAEDVAAFADKLGFGGIGRYETFTHVDTWGVSRRWDHTSPVFVTP